MRKIQANDYVFIVSAGKMKGSGLGRNDLLMVVGTRSVPASRRDPYLTRELIVAIRVTDDGVHQIPKEGNDYQAYLIDPRNVELLPAEASVYLAEKLKEQYGAK